MAHESFEDEGVAQVMNEHFINIKVDREERPDLDQIYQTAHQMLARRPGGWPLTMFLAPDGTPFFGGTYFPLEPRFGLPGFVDLMHKVVLAYQEQRVAIEQQNGTLRGALARMVAQGSTHHSDLGREPITRLLVDLDQTFDRAAGGFGGAPKFPHPAELRFLLQQHARSGDPAAREMALTTLRRMAEGGIHDQLGGGFCRYSVDAAWQIPHFEKMLYDNGPLLGLYADAWALTREPLFARVVEAGAAWVMREMQAPEGGYYSSLDADSEGEEGRFYVWDASEIEALLTAEEYAVLAPHYGLDGPPNFEQRHWHLAVARGLAEVAGLLGLPLAVAEARLQAGQEKLRAARARRVRPGRADKILTSWNALMIEGMARAARVFGRADWLASARGAADFLRSRMWQDGRLLATCKNGPARLNAYLDDHAYLLAALLELLQAGYRRDELEFAEELADALLEAFEDRASGGFFFTRHDHEVLIQRPKAGHDNATPSGNGVAALALQRLGHLTGELRYLDAAERTLQGFYAAMRSATAGFGSLCSALEEYLQPGGVVILRGAAAEIAPWAASLGQRFAPDLLVLALPPDAAGLTPVLDKPLHKAACAWLCWGVECGPALDSAQALEDALARVGRR
jgi:uncharacterized protein YyaL (SSP411 family)